MLLILLYNILIAGTFTLSKALLNYQTPIFCVAIRMISAGSVILAGLYLWNRAAFRFNWKDSVLFVKVTVFSIYVSFVADFLGLETVSSAKACLIFNLAPFVAALYSYFWFNEKMGYKKIIGLAIGFLGFLPLIMAESPEEIGFSIGFVSIGEILMFISMFTATYGWVVFRKLSRDLSYSPWFINGISMFFGGLLSLITSLIFEGSPRLLVGVGQQNPSYAWTVLTSYVSPYVASLVLCITLLWLLIIMSNFICYNLYGYLLRDYTATFLSFAGFVTPLFAALYGWFFLGETVSSAFFITMIIVLFGLYLFYQEETA